MNGKTDDDDEIFMFTNQSTKPNSTQGDGTPRGLGDKEQQQEYIITGYNLDAELEQRSRQAKMEMLKNVSSKQSELQR